MISCTRELSDMHMPDSRKSLHTARLRPWDRESTCAVWTTFRTSAQGATLRCSRSDLSSRNWANSLFCFSKLASAMRVSEKWAGSASATAHVTMWSSSRVCSLKYLQ